MLWQHYVFRRGPDVHTTWELMFEHRPIRLLYIAGGGFDVRAQIVMKELVGNISDSHHTIQDATLVLVDFTGYDLTGDLRVQTEKNNEALGNIFKTIGSSTKVSLDSSRADDDISASNALRLGANKILSHIDGQTDIVLDVSSLPRVVYLALLTGILNKLITEREAPNALVGGGVNFQVLVAEDAALDADIRSEDPSNDLILIPGYSGALHAESYQDWPLVWFPILCENKLSQLQKVLELAIPPNAEICPVLPHPSRDPRRADRLVLEYREALIDARRTPTANILFAHESNPFEAYRQLLKAMKRYQASMDIMGGCRLVVTPLASKLITLGVGLACFEMKPFDMTTQYGVAIPYAEPTRYTVPVDRLNSSRPEISTLVLTGEAYCH